MTASTIIIKLGICVSYYNDVECLKRLVKSIFPLPPKYNGGGPNNRYNVVFIAVDGRYRGYDEEKPDTKEYRRSDDGSYELIESLRNSGQHFKRHIINTAAPVTFDERYKRQTYVDIAAMQGCDFLIIIDSDEWFETIRWNKLFTELVDIKRYEWDKAEGNIYSIRIVSPGEEQEQPHYWPRLWCSPDQIRYGNRHWEFVRNTKEDQHSKPRKIRQISDNIIKIRHDPNSCRSKERQELQKDYESRLSTLESAG